MTGEQKSAEGGLEQWDLTNKNSAYLDRHMMFPLLEYLDGQIKADKISYSSKDVAAARLALLRPTHMVDYAVDTYKSVHGESAEIPQEMEEQKKQVFKQLEELESGCKPLTDLCNNAEEKTKLISEGQWSIDALSQKEDMNITPEVLEIYRKTAKFQFDCGDYQTARDMLENYISLLAKPPAPTIDSNILQVLWGRLACEILVEGWEAASVALDAALSERTWLLHWSLFVYWNNSAKGGLEQLVELFHTERYKQAITTNAPHLLRYLTAAVLLCKRRITKKAAAGSNAEARRLMKNLINVMQDCDHSDPIVEFVNCLCVKFDFESAQTKLAECEKVLDADFFLCKQTGLFMEEARVFVFENYCRIHNKIDLEALGKKLAMNEDEAERWIVDLIRNADLDAKIDAAEGCVVMGGSVQSVYEQVMERTRDLNVRSAALTQNLNKLLGEARRDKAKKAREEAE
ncbi:hypothetical protein FRACYDRAFT_172037 [Fragilariopsis cylindrus CCMP1102]|uniref:Eukaryotic translation initiation factor 3 subunit E n=1 Tax=Fragilariopsis cylindrus CCMP1102 TaxID=635003 RepID=A0A1E7F5G6_9STRA|nr:hypothetical protein FRACYDRAFT_172037 [Fragilariopsis cylindrus CCMP1102]|eukprot:OEU13103.1 hypothetical protein FRACYDRAFT_172037 [Fragilariopsis cylindrus CCMP1102]